MSDSNDSSGPSTETMRLPLITNRTGVANWRYLSVNQSPISSAASTPSTDWGHVKVSPSGRLPQWPCSQYLPSLGTHLRVGEKVATRSVPSEVLTEIFCARRA